VLGPNEKAAFDGMVTRLRADDPVFSRRVDRLGRPRRGLRVATAVLLWTLAPLCVVFGGWTGLIMAVVAIGYGTGLVAGRRGRVDGTSWLTHRRPGVSN
jgi:hypothetical protein